MLGFSKLRKTKSKKRFQKEWEDAFIPEPAEPMNATNDVPDKELESISDLSFTEIDGDTERTIEIEEMTYEEEDVEPKSPERNHNPEVQEKGYLEANNFREDILKFENAVNVVSTVFVKYNVSRQLAQDIFAICDILRLHSSLKLKDVDKKIDEWGSWNTRIYSFCLGCSHTLNSSKRCGNENCPRYSISQANVSALKTVVTFSIRKQVEHLICSEAFDYSLLERSQEQAKLNSRLCDTPRYKERVRYCEQKYPDKITIFLTMNTDGFRKRGCSRGEIWPLFLAVNDVTKGEGKFREYAPEMTILSAIMQTSSKLTPSDFDSLFQRMHIEIEETNLDPLKIMLNNTEYSVRLELFQCVLDMDASRKIRGIPIWQSYSSCSRCDVKGRQIATKSGKSICWCPEGNVNDYDEFHIPKKLIKSVIPAPHTDGFDGLHIILEGTSRDLLKDLLAGGTKLGKKMNKQLKLLWSESLNSANTPRGRVSSGLLDPIQLSTRTGREVQELYDIALPVLISLVSPYSDWKNMIMLHWLVTRKVTDWMLSNYVCDDIDFLLPFLRNIVSNTFSTFYTLKFHFFIDHMAPKLRFYGSPLLSSAAPFERLNQSMGRSSNSYTTRTLLNISRRFLALKKAEEQNVCRSNTEDIGTASIKTDFIPLTNTERLELFEYKPVATSFRTSWSNGNITFSVRRACCQHQVHSCYVYFIDSNGKTDFGCIERIFQDEYGTQLILMQKFLTVDPFSDTYPSLFSTNSGLFFAKDSFNTYFRQIISSSYVVINSRCLEGLVSILEYRGASYLSRC